MSSPLFTLLKIDSPEKKKKKRKKKELKTHESVYQMSLMYQHSYERYNRLHCFVNKPFMLTFLQFVKWG